MGTLMKVFPHVPVPEEIIMAGKKLHHGASRELRPLNTQHKTHNNVD